MTDAMIYNPAPLHRRPEDSAPAADLQADLIEAAELLAEHVDELERLRDLMTRWGTDPTGVCRRAQPRTIEHAERAGKLRELLTTISQGCRTAGLLSAPYSSRRA